MFVSHKFAKKKKYNIKSSFQILGGRLNGAKIVLIDPTEGDPSQDWKVDYKNILGRQIQITDYSSNIFLSFNKCKVGSNGQRLTLLVAGPSGAGKSTFCINYMNIFRKQMKNAEKYPIYFITTIIDDPRLKKIDNCIVIDLNDEEMLNYYFVDPETRLSCNQDFMGLSNLNNSLVVVDDAEQLDKNKRILLEDLLANIMKYGRHNNCNLIWSRHLINGNNKLVQESLSELMYIVLFKDGAHRRLSYFCEKYLDHGKDLVDWIRKDSGCRYTIIHNRIPAFLLNDKILQVLD